MVPARLTTVQWLDAAGKTQPLLAKPGRYGYPNLSPDGKRLAVRVDDGEHEDIWVYDKRRDTMTRLTSGSGVNQSPIWTPDGRHVVFSSLARGIFWARADGAGQPQPFTQPTMQAAGSFSPDGKRLAYVDQDDDQRFQIWTVPVEGGGGQLRWGKPEAFLKTQSNDGSPMFSPDGHWLMYQSDESGKFEVYVRPFPPPLSGQGAKWQISNKGGESPVWSRNGHELLYRCGDQIMAVSYTAKGDSFQTEKPRVWTTILDLESLASSSIAVGATNFDLAPDGKHLAVVMPVARVEGSKPEHEVTLVFNFFDELRRRGPMGK